MSTKGTKGFFVNLKNRFSKADPAEEQNKEEQLISDSRSRERNMIALLDKIDLDDPLNKLSPEKIRDLNIAALIRYVSEELQYPLITGQDIINLDNNIEYMILALGEAIREGRETTAEWACSALISVIKDLRTDIAGTDKDYAGEMMECRVEYSNNLVLLLKCSKEYDYLRATLENERSRRQEAREQLEHLKSHYQSRRDSGELDELLAELEQNIHAPHLLGDKALALRDELNQLHLHKAALIEMDASINAHQVNLNGRESEIKSRRNVLASPPHVVDPKLQDRINDANIRYREQLRRALNQAEKAMREYDIHIHAMEDLARHSVHITSVARAREMAKKLEEEQYHQMLREKAAQELRNRAAETLRTIKESIAAQEIEDNRDIETAIEPETQAEIVQEEQQDTAYNVLYDLE